MFRHSGKIWRTDDNAFLCCPRGVFKTFMQVWGFMRHYHTIETPISNCSERAGYYDAHSLHSENRTKYCTIVAPEALENLTAVLTDPMGYPYEITMPNGEIVTVYLRPHMLLVWMVQLPDRLRLLAPGVALKIPLTWVNSSLMIHPHMGVIADCDTCAPPPPPAVPQPYLVCPTPGFDGLYMGGKREIFVATAGNVPPGDWPAMMVQNVEVRGAASMVLDILGLVLTEQQWQNVSVAMLTLWAQGHPAECRWSIGSLLYDDYGNHFDVMSATDLGIRCGSYVDFDSLLFPGVTPTGEPQLDEGPAPLLLNTPKLFWHNWNESYEYHVQGCEPCDLGLCSDSSNGPLAHTTELARLSQIYDL